ncbi:MAG: hypothetical protein K2X01_02155 [Cyanobacteria bacterium]|nr:hypothetical protein [Cyanobacteriota bacterium]
MRLAPEMLLNLYFNGFRQPPNLKRPFFSRESAVKPRGDVLSQVPPIIHPKIMRLVLKGPAKPDAAQAILAAAFEQWPTKTHCRYFILPGGFLEIPLPENWQGISGWEGRSKDKDAWSRLADSVARPALEALLTPQFYEAARGKCDYLSLGLDIVSEQGMHGPHLELVAMADIQKKKIIRWTGKSFPTRNQDKQLIQVTDLGSHLLAQGKERVVILGCNDLNLLSPRVSHNVKSTSPRGRLVRQMQALVKAFRPTVILQHPHETDTPNSWLTTWRHIENTLPSLRHWAGTVRYHNAHKAPRQPLERVLELTQGSSDPATAQNIVIDTSAFVSRPSRYLNNFKWF